MPDELTLNGQRLASIEDRVSNHSTMLAQHSTQLALVEQEIKQMTPRLEMTEVIRPLEAQVRELTLMMSAGNQRTESEIAGLASELKEQAKLQGEFMQRFARINEESMQRLAQQAEEKHELEVKAEKVRAERLEKENTLLQQRIENGRWDKKMERLAKMAGWIVGIAAAIATVGSIFYNYILPILMHPLASTAVSNSLPR
jgi:hypothetical protein